MTSYLRCLRSHRGTNGSECRMLSKSYLQCRMDQCVPTYILNVKLFPLRSSHTSLSYRPVTFKLPHFVAVTPPLLHPSLHPASLVIGTVLTACKRCCVLSGSEKPYLSPFRSYTFFGSDGDPDAAERWLHWHIGRTGLTSTLDTATSWHLTRSRTLASPSRIQRPLHLLHRPPFRLPPRPQQLPQRKHNKGGAL